MNAPFRPAAPTTLDSIKRHVAGLPHRDQIELIRSIANGMSGYARGFDKIDAGCDAIINDLDDEQITIDCGGVLPDDAWAYGRFADTIAPLNQITGRV